MKYILQERYGNEFNAGSKARNDAEKIALKCGYQLIVMDYSDYGNSKTIVSRIGKNITCVGGWSKLIRTLKSGDTLLIQHPMQSGAFAAKLMMTKLKKKGIRAIALIHDLASLRSMGEDNKTSNIHDFIILPQYDKVISHNDRMTKILIEKYEIPAKRIINLGIFDYLCQVEKKKKVFDNSVTIAGNLNFEKCPYVRKFIKSFRGTLHLYGVGLEEKNYGENVHYHGSFPPDELPNVMEGSFGIVWDGRSITACTGNTGKYLKYNNPHKTSLYLAAGIPVIVWSKAAMAGFVKEHHVGIVVDTLDSLESVLADVNETEYLLMRENARKIAVLLQKGDYLTKALSKCGER